MLRQRRSAPRAALVAWLRDRGVEAQTEEFRGYSTFGKPYALLFGASLAGGLLQRSRNRGARRAGDVLAVASAIAATLESDLRWTPLSDALSREPSVNVVAQRARRGTDAATRLSGAVISTPAAPARSSIPRVAASPRETAADPGDFGVPARGRPAAAAPARRRALHSAALGGMALSLAVLAERELRGQDVPGASDNASGAAVAMQLAAECAAAPLEHTEVDLLITSCEESGLLGAQAYARRHKLRAAETTFLNFDTVGGPAPLTYILREGSATMNRPASERLIEMLEAIAQRRPELGLDPGAHDPGPADRRDADARARVGGGHAARPGGHDSQLPLAHGHLREHRSAHRRTGARNRPRAAASRSTPRSGGSRRPAANGRAPAAVSTAAPCTAAAAPRHRHACARRAAVRRTCVARDLRRAAWPGTTAAPRANAGSGSGDTA